MGRAEPRSAELGGIEPSSAKDKTGPSSDNKITLETSNKLVCEGKLSDNSRVSQVPSIAYCATSKPGESLLQDTSCNIETLSVSIKNQIITSFNPLPIIKR